LRHEKKRRKNLFTGIHRLFQNICPRLGQQEALPIFETRTERIQPYKVTATLASLTASDAEVFLSDNMICHLLSARLSY
jgi:hypothetical protein